MTTRFAGSIVVAALLSIGLSHAGSAAEARQAKGVFPVREYGAVGDGKAKDTQAIQKAIDAAAAAGGGTVHFPPGEYLSGTVYLKSRVRLHIDFAAKLLGSTDQADFPVNRCEFRSYTDKYVTQGLIWGENLHDVALVGPGTIDGQGAAFKGLPWLERPYVIRLIACRNVTVRDLTLLNSPMWMQHYLACDLVTVQGINVYNHCNANNDMIDIDCCRDVRISDCYGDTDDDALTLKSTADRPCENVTITNCVLASHCNPFKMGTESNGGFKNITVSNLTIRQSADGDPIAGRRDGLAGIALEIVDGGTLDRVAVSNVSITGVTVPFFMRLGNRARPFKQDMPKPAVGTFRNVVLSNILASEVSKVGCSITGLPDHPVENVTLSNVKITFAGGGTKEDAARSIPELPEKYPESTMFGTLPAYGLYCRHVAGLSLRDVDLRVAGPDQRPALVCEDVRNLAVDAFSAQPPTDAAPLIVLDNVRTAMIRGCTPPAAAAFLRLQNKTDRVSVIGNDLSSLPTPFQYDPTVSPSVILESGNRGPK